MTKKTCSIMNVWVPVFVIFIMLSGNFINHGVSAQGVPSHQNIVYTFADGSSEKTLQFNESGILIEHLDIPEARVRVIPLGVSAARDLAVSRPAFLAADEPFLFTIGFVEAKKNFHVLVRLLPDLTGQRLVIAGSNRKAYARQIMAYARELGVADRVIMPGSIPEAEKQWLYAHCSAFVFPSLLEGFGLPVLEAMAHGKPVFISDKGPLPEVGGPDAFVWTDFSREALVETFQRGMREFHGDSRRPERHRAHAATFTWRRTAEAYLSVYREASG